MSRLLEFDGRTQAEDTDFADLFALLAPIGREEFFNDYWEKTPFVIRGRAESSVRRVLDVADIDRVVGSRALRPTDLRAAKDHSTLGKAELFPEGVADKQAVLDAFRRGYSLIFDQVDRHLPPLAEALYAWESELGLQVRANAFLTPRASSGFHRHYDTHDVIVVQVHGRKTWDVCDSPLPLPHEEQQPQSSRWARDAELIARIEMTPGDLLYLPRGFVHAASADDTDSLHISVSIRNLALRDVCHSAIRELFEASPMWRKGFMPGRTRPESLQALLRSLPDDADLSAALDRIRTLFHSNRRKPENRLRRLQADAEITVDTRLRMKNTVSMHRQVLPDAIQLVADGRSARFDGSDAGVVAYACSAGEFRVNDLPCADAAGRIAIARRMHVTGIVDPVEDIY